MKMRAIRTIQIDLDETEFETVMLSLRNASGAVTSDLQLSVNSAKLYDEIEKGLDNLGNPFTD